MALQVTEVQKSLRGVDYPATGEELARHAQQHGAGKELVEALRELAGQQFNGPNAVMQELRGKLGGPTG